MQQKVNCKKHKGDTRFVLEVQLITKVDYVSVEEPTNDRVSFNPIPLELPPRSPQFFTINPHEEEGNANFPELNHNPWKLSSDA
jgi:hypothetical protein